MLQCAVGGHLPHIYREHDYLHGAAAVSPLTARDPKLESDLKAATDRSTALETELKAMKDTVAGLNTQIVDLKAAAAKKPGEADPHRKTLSASATALLDKHGLKAGDDGRVSVEAVAKALEAAGVKGTAAMTAKLKLRQEGVLN